MANIEFNFSGICARIAENPDLKPNHSFFRTIFWFLFSVAAVIGSIHILMALLNIAAHNPLTAGMDTASLKLILIITACCLCYSIWCLLWSKEMVKRIYQIHIITPGNFNSVNEKELYSLVEILSKRAGLDKIPAVGVYKAPEMNAFAVGASRNNALILFSDRLLANMTNNAVAAIAGHEVAHIANGDMLNMTIIRASVLALAVIIQIPFIIANIFLLATGKRQKDLWDWALIVLTMVIQFLVLKFTLFGGNILALYFSRHREYRADQMAAELVDAPSMITALESLLNNQVAMAGNHNRNEKELAMFKVSGAESVMELFSTHPTIRKRIARLKGTNNI